MIGNGVFSECRIYFSRLIDDWRNAGVMREEQALDRIGRNNTMAKDRDFERLKPEDRLGGAPVEPGYKKAMVAVVQMLDEVFNGNKKGGDRDTGFILLVFPFGDKGGRTNYMSNGANRADVVRMMEEQIRRFKTDTDDDRLTIEQMARAIQEICVDSNGKSLVNETMSIAAAATCLVIYRKGPADVHFVGGQRIDDPPEKGGPDDNDE